LSFLSTHPASDDRVEYLEQLIEHNGYNRYAFEGVEKHREIQENLK
jgi:Zn-dependent protease with chaperone function